MLSAEFDTRSSEEEMDAVGNFGWYIYQVILLLFQYGSRERIRHM